MLDQSMLDSLKGIFAAYGQLYTIGCNHKRQKR